MIVDTDKYDKAVERLLRGEKMLNVGIDIRAKDGSIKNAILSSEIIDNQGIKNILTVMIDETENNLLHYSLEAERIRLENIIQGTGVGTWEWNIETGETKFNEAWAYMAGYTLEELAPINIDTWIKLTHPEDLAKAELNFKKHFNGHIVQKIGTFIYYPNPVKHQTIHTVKKLFGRM